MLLARHQMKPIFILSLLILVLSCRDHKKTMTGQQYFTTADSVRIMYVEKGDPGKTPIIFLQGSDGTSFEWQVFTEKLKDKYRLILFDRRGNGLSTRLLPGHKLTMEAYLNDIAGLQQKMGIEKCVILGWSFGGAVAAEYELKYPDKVSSLILVNPLSDANQLWIDRAEAIYPVALKNNDTLALKTIDKLKKGNSLTIEDEYEIVKVQNAVWYNKATADSFYTKTDVKLYGYTDSTLSTDWENLIAQKKIYDGYSNLNRISKINCPTLIIGGTHDHIISPAQCEKIHALMPASKMKIIQNSGHLPFIEKPDELEVILTGFIK